MRKTITALAALAAALGISTGAEAADTVKIGMIMA
jgi:hypothetical protein